MQLEYQYDRNQLIIGKKKISFFFFFEKALDNLLNSRNHRNSFEDISGLEKKCFH